MDPILRATTTSGAVWDDPSEDLLFELLSDIERGDEQFVVVERLSDETGQTYAQSIRNDDGSYLVERRDGTPGKHFDLRMPDMRGAHAVLTAWAHEKPDWRTRGRVRW